MIRHRLQVFAETTGLLVPYYTERRILVAVDADQPPDSVAADIQARLSGLAEAERLFTEARCRYRGTSSFPPG